MKDYLGSDVTLWLEDHFLSGLRPSFVEHGIVGENFRDLTLAQMQRLNMGTEHLQVSFIKFRDQQLREETGEPERIIQRALVYKELNELRKQICKKLHTEECKVEEINKMADASTPLLSNLLKIDWEEEPEMCDMFSKMVDVDRKPTTKQKPKLATVDQMLSVGKEAQAQFVQALESWIATVGLSSECLVIGDVKGADRLQSKAEADGVSNLFDLNRATVLCKKVSQVLNLTNTVVMVFVQPMTFKNKFKVGGDAIKQPPCLFYQVGLQLSGAAADLLESPNTPWIVEIQVTTEQFFDTKQYAHEFYEITRETKSLPKECPFCRKPTRYGLTLKGEQVQAAPAPAPEVQAKVQAAPEAEGQAQAQASLLELESLGGLNMDDKEEADKDDDSGEEANGPEVTTDEKKDVQAQAETCPSCSKRGHRGSACFIAHPEKQLEALQTAVRMIVGQFGAGQGPRKTLPLNLLASLWRYYADIKPVLFKGITLKDLAEKDPNFLSVDEPGMCTMTTHFTPCPNVMAGARCTEPHGAELRHQCLFGDKCPVKDLCVFHKNGPSSPVPVPVKPIKVIIALICQFGKKHEDGSVCLARTELEGLMVRYSQCKPHKALPQLSAAVLAASGLTVQSGEVHLENPRVYHRCTFSNVKFCPRGPECKFPHSKKEPRNKSPKPTKGPKESKKKPKKESKKEAKPPKDLKKTVGIYKSVEDAKFLWANRKSITATGCRVTLNAVGGNEMAFALTGTSQQLDQAMAVIDDLLGKLPVSL